MHNIPLSFISEETLAAIARHQQRRKSSPAGRSSFRKMAARFGELLLNFDGPNSVLNFERAMRGSRPQPK